MSQRPESSKAASESNSSTATPNGVDAVVPKLEQLGHDEGDESEEEGDEVAGPGASGGAGGEDGAGKKKKKKKRKPKSKATKAVEDESVTVLGDNMILAQPGGGAQDSDMRKALQAVDLMKLLQNQLNLANPSGNKTMAEHKFWKTQPVPQAEASPEVNEGPIDAIKSPEEITKEPGALPSGFEWSVIDVKAEDQMLEVHTLLTENYVEDDDAMFRFRYSKDFLLWALTPPGYTDQWHIGVRVQKTGKLVAFISGIPVELRCRSKLFNSAEINFLCVHKKLRAKRLAPVLIKEVTRRINLTDVWQAIYTAGVVIPTPFSTCRYYHRNLNPPKLVDIGFSPLPRGQTIARLVRQYAAGDAVKTPGFREMVAADVPQISTLLKRYLERFPIAQTFNNEADVAHWFLSGLGKDINGKREGQVVWAYVVEDPTTHLITDMVSFYSLPSTIMQHAKYDTLNAAYMYYYASDVVFAPAGSSDDAFAHDLKTTTKLDERLNALVRDLLVVAQKAGFDVVNALTLLDNNMFLQDQQFGPGDGFLNYYLYNWSTAPIDGGMGTTGSRQGSGVGVVML